MLPLSEEDHHRPGVVLDDGEDDWRDREQVPDDDGFEPLPQDATNRIMLESEPQMITEQQLPHDIPEFDREVREISERQPRSVSEQRDLDRDVPMRLSVLSDNEAREVEFFRDYVRREPTVLLSPMSTVPTQPCDTPHSLIIGDDDSEDKQIPNGYREITSRTSEKCEALFIYPPPPEKAGISIYMEDYCCLEIDKYLNDVIIDFYLKYLSHQLMSPADAEVTHIFSSLFFTRLSNPPGCTKTDDPNDEAQKRHAGVSRWTKSINIFEKNFIIIPVHEHAHWYLVIICFPGFVGYEHPSGFTFEGRGKIEEPCILIFDSSSTSKKTRVVRILRSYLASEFKAKYGVAKSFANDELQVIYPNAPSQKNTTDCGLFVLQYVESFFKTPSIEPGTNLKKWFKDNVILRKREELAKLIVNLAKDQNPGKIIKFPQLAFPIVPPEDLSSDEKCKKNVISSEKKRVSRFQRDSISESSSSDSRWISREDTSSLEVKKKLVKRNRNVTSSDEDSDGYCSSSRTNTAIDLDQKDEIYTGQVNLSSMTDYQKPRSKHVASTTSYDSRSRKIMNLGAQEIEKKRSALKTYARKEIMRPRTAVAADVQQNLRPALADKFYGVSAYNNDRGLDPMMGYSKFKKNKKLLCPENGIYSPPKQASANTLSEKKRMSRVQRSSISENSSCDIRRISREDTSPLEVKKKLVKRNRNVISSDEDSDGYCSSSKTNTAIDLDQKDEIYTGQVNLSSMTDYQKPRSKHVASTTSYDLRSRKIMNLGAQETEKKRLASKPYAPHPKLEKYKKLYCPENGIEDV